MLVISKAPAFLYKGDLHACLRSCINFASGHQGTLMKGMEGDQHNTEPLWG